MSQRLGDLLVKEKVITPEQLAQATKVQKETTPPRLTPQFGNSWQLFFGSAFEKPGQREWNRSFNFPYFETLDSRNCSADSVQTAKRYQILPLSRVGASLTIAMVDPTSIHGRYQVHDRLQH
jgi:type IV pilus assembly protein PilB